MILTTKKPYSEEEIRGLQEQFDRYIKTVIDIQDQKCSAGCDRHADSEQILLEQGSKQEYLWGGGIDLDTLTIDGNSFINIRPSQNNPSNEIQDLSIRKKFEDQMKFFFRTLYE